MKTKTSFQYQEEIKTQYRAFRNSSTPEEKEANKLALIATIEEAKHARPKGFYRLRLFRFYPVTKPRAPTLRIKGQTVTLSEKALYALQTECRLKGITVPDKVRDILDSIYQDSQTLKAPPAEDELKLFQLNRNNVIKLNRKWKSSGNTPYKSKYRAQLVTLLSEIKRRFPDLYNQNKLSQYEPIKSREPNAKKIRIRLTRKENKIYTLIAESQGRTLYNFIRTTIEDYINE